MASTSEPSQKTILTENGDARQAGGEAPAEDRATLRPTTAMPGMTLGLLGRVLYPKWLLGPILDKELRVSARRRRNYVIRLAYVALLAMVIGLVWYEIIGRYEYQYNNALQSSQMAELGRTLVIIVVWFQFMAAQLLAVITLSTAISDEISRRTLGVLMSTPVTALQVVMGKLTSKLLQIMILLAISLPILAVVRIFGGIPWGFIVAGLCLTVCCAVFIASLSLLCSIHTRHAYWAIFAALMLILVIFGAPIVVRRQLIDLHVASEQKLTLIYSHFHPFFPMYGLTEALRYPYYIGQMGAFAWQTCCLVMLALTAGVVLLCAARLRKVSLRQATGDHGKAPRMIPATTARVAAGTHNWPRTAKIRRVSGPPMLWKETRQGLLRGHWRWIVPLGTLGLLAASYLLIGRDMHDGGIQAAYVVILLGLACLLTMILSPTGMTSEREARSLPVLLMTPLSDFSIVMGKVLGVIRRVWPIWALLMIHVAVMLMLWSEPSRAREVYIHPVLALHLLLICVYTLAFLCAVGMLIGTLVRNSTTAVILTLVTALVLWLGVPLLLLPVGHGEEFTRLSLTWANPFYQAAVVTEGANRNYSYHQTVYGNQYWTDQDEEGRYRFDHRTTTGGATRIIAITAGGFLTVSAFLVWLASLNVRRMRE
jgi:ABC-type transport system involved in multi-copper enzyme maturation permease subunit